MSCCISDCDFTVNGSSVDLYTFTITDESQQEINVSTFQSATDLWLSCGQAGNITFGAFQDISVSRGDTGVSFTANVCGDSYSGNCTCTSFSVGGDRTAGDVPRFTYTCRLESLAMP